MFILSYKDVKESQMVFLIPQVREVLEERVVLKVSTGQLDLEENLAHLEVKELRESVEKADLRVLRDIVV